MSASNLSSNDISALIEHVLRSKDPAAVGLKHILKNQNDRGKRYPLRRASQEEFYVAGKTGEALSSRELVVVELEKQISSLRKQVETLEKRLPQRERAAYEKGREEGTAKGILDEREALGAQYGAKINDVQKRLSAFLSGVEQSKKSIFVNAHTVLLALCFEIAEKILCAEASCNRQVVLSVIKKALAYIADKDNVVIRVAKDDMETVSGRKDFWLPVGERLSSLTIEPDERIERGGCVIESNSGVADARLGVQLGQLRELVESLWKSIGASARQSNADEVS